MHILWISPSLPWPLRSGGTTRTYHLMKAAAQAHTLTSAHLGRPEEPIPAEMRALCAETHLFHHDMTRAGARRRSLLGGRSQYRLQYRSGALNRWLSRQVDRFDLAVITNTHMSWAALPKNLPRIYDLQNIESEVVARSARIDPHLGRRLYRRWDAVKFKREEFASFKKAAELWIPSPREKELLTTAGVSTPITVVPNGVDPEQFLPARRQPDRPEVVFIGLTHFYPNEQGLLWFFDEVWSRILAARPLTTLAVVGGRPREAIARLDGGPVRVTGYVADVVPYYQSARLFIIPLLAGGGTRLKLLEAAAAGAPIVTTSIGCEGIEFSDGVHGRIADDPQTFTAACLETLAGGPAVEARRAAARALVCTRYDWQKIGRRVRDRLASYA